MAKHIAFFRDGSSPPELVNHINNLGGALITDPRPDLRGDFIVTDIVHVNLHSTSAGWAATAILAVMPYKPSSPFVEIGAVVDRERAVADIATEISATLSPDILN